MDKSKTFRLKNDQGSTNNISSDNSKPALSFELAFGFWKVSVRIRSEAKEKGILRPVSGNKLRERG
jgi:hypothetical protein